MKYLIILAVLLVSACADYRQTLDDGHGKSVQCAEAGYGLLWAMMAKSDFDKCVKDYEAKGYTKEP